MNKQAEKSSGGNGDRKTRRPCAPDSVHHDYLRLLGERVRNARARHGMTRRSLSQDSGVSERYLAQLESGQGNVSIVLLRDIANAMNMTIADLVREGPEPPVELTLLQEYLGRLTAAQLSEAHELLIERFGQPQQREGRIALIGLRGAGKTTVGRLLGERLDVPVMELATEVERDAGMATAEIFDLYGQAAFRRFEQRCLERLIEENERAVIVMPGGSVSEPATLEMLLSGCFTVWLQASPEEHMRRVVAQGDQRPMAGNPEAMDDLRRILEARRPLYNKADIAIDTTGRTPDDVAGTILEQRPRSAAPMAAAVNA